MFEIATVRVTNPDGSEERVVFPMRDGADIGLFVMSNEDWRFPCAEFMGEDE